MERFRDNWEGFWVTWVARKAIQAYTRPWKAPRSPGQVNLPRRCGCFPWLGEAFRGFRSCRTLEGHIWPWKDLPLLVMCPLGGAFVPCRFISILLPSPLILKALCSCPIWMRRYPHHNNYPLRNYLFQLSWKRFIQPLSRTWVNRCSKYAGIIPQLTFLQSLPQIHAIVRSTLLFTILLPCCPHGLSRYFNHRHFTT